jgi:predicted site-specific integrase-resolvase
VSRLTGWATDAGKEVGQVVAEVGSGLDGKRPKLARVLSDPSASVIVVEHHDRLARFGWSICMPRWPRRADGSWSSTTVRPFMIWCAT